MRETDAGEPQAALLLLGEIIEQLGADRRLAGEVLGRAHALGADPLVVLAHRLRVSLALAYGAAARRLGFAFSDHISDLVDASDLSPVALADFAGLRSLRGRIGGEDVLFAAPDFVTLIAIARTVGREDPLRGQMCIVPPDALHRAVTRHASDRLLEQAIARPGAAIDAPGARLGVRTPAGAVLVGLLALCLLVGLLTPFGLFPTLAAFLSLVLLVPSAMRIWAAIVANRVLPLAPDVVLNDAELPEYTVLIPLREEAHMVGQLVTALDAMDYPPEKLDVKFIVESASPETIAAVARHTEDPRFSLVVVPEGGPATKPKALNYALPLARGRHLVIYDAEDIPEPGQLRLAASVFAQREDLACLQASLTINNADRSWITRMFAAEYAGQFQVLLPAIGHARLPMPLGGSSNHFRLDVLMETGGWDPFNVTEDADLGLRLARLGHHCAALDSHTFEEAPVSWQSWHNQRGRWMKGWMQTLIVHNHAPRTLLADLGLVNLLAVNTFVGGMVLSTALHGAFLLSLLSTALAQVSLTGSIALSNLVYLVLLLLGYAGAAAASVIGLRRIGRSDLSPWLVGLPAYWLMGGFAAATAVKGLVLAPYYWAKTSHAGPARAGPDADTSYDVVANRPADAPSLGE